MAQPPARYAFRNLNGLMDSLSIGESAADLKRALEQAGHKTPSKSTVERICTAGQLMKKLMAEKMVKALQKHAANHNVDPRSADLSLILFDSHVVGLGNEIARACGGLINADVDQVADIANHAGVSQNVILAASKGKCVELPYELAGKISIAASQVLKLSEPLAVLRSNPMMSSTKPIGGSKLELGAKPFQCIETKEIRSAILGWAS